MALHQGIQRLLLLGVRLPLLEPAATCQPPKQLAALIEAVAPEHHKFDTQALHYGHRYRSGFWAIYLLSSIAVLCAVLPFDVRRFCRDILDFAANMRISDRPDDAVSPALARHKRDTLSSLKHAANPERWPSPAAPSRRSTQ